MNKHQNGNLEDRRLARLLAIIYKRKLAIDATETKRIDDIT